jgi:uncharacterized protein YbaR (Trm112 family)
LCPSHAWDSYINSYPEFLGCPLCREESEDTWIEVEKEDPNRSRLEEKLRCSNCGVYFDFVQQHWDSLIVLLNKEET